MKRYNIVMLVDETGENVLMCHRRKPPYQGLYNLVGGKAEPGEDGLHAAYRELREETGVTAADATLYHLATFSYPTGGAGLPAYELMAYVGRLRRHVDIAGDENPLLWMPLTENFFDLRKYAGEGSIGHVVESVRVYRLWMIEQRKQEVTLTQLCEEDLPILAYYQNNKEAKFAVRADGCMVGVIYQREDMDGTDGDPVEIFPPFRQCGFEEKAMMLLNAVKGGSHAP